MANYCRKLCLLILLCLIPYDIFSLVSAHSPDQSSGVNIICNATVYPAACSRSFGLYPHSVGNTTSAKKLVAIALRAAKLVIAQTKLFSRSCSNAVESTNKLEKEAIEDCVELMQGAKEQLDLAIANLSSVVNGNDWNEKQDALHNLGAWLSSAISFQTACMDGFSSFAELGNCEIKMANRQKQVLKALANGLDLVKKLATRGSKIKDWKIMKPRKKFPGPAAAGYGLWERHLLDEGRDKSVSLNPAASGGVKGRFKMDRDGFPMWAGTSEQRRRILTGPSPAPAPSPRPADAPPLGCEVDLECPDLVVAKDGSGNFTNITEAIASINATSYLSAGRRFVVYIMEGLYDETFEVPKALANLTFIGDGINGTIITGNHNVASGNYTTFRCATVVISAIGFWARDISFINTAGPQGQQAVALRASGDRAVFYRCGFEGYQDTLYAHAGRHFYRECMIYGTVDFIFGNAIASFQECVIGCRKPRNGQQNTVTAQGRTVEVDISGFVFENCSLIAGDDLIDANYSVRSYLGRPWKAYSRVVFLQSFMDSVIDPAGWYPWNSSYPYVDTLYYGEFDNRGPGSATGLRVAWPGVHPNLTLSQALPFAAQSFIFGSSWLPLDWVAYTSNLTIA